MSNEFEAPFIPVQIRGTAARDFTVRQSELADFGALVQMYKSFEPKGVAQGLPPRELRRIAHWLARLHEKSRALLALEGERVVAHAILCPISEAAVEYTIFVHQDFRRQGIGAALSRLAVEWAREAGFAELYISTELSNKAALGLYQKAGFRITSSLDNECEMKLVVVPAWQADNRAA